MFGTIRKDPCYTVIKRAVIPCQGGCKQRHVIREIPSRSEIRCHDTFHTAVGANWEISVGDGSSESERSENVGKVGESEIFVSEREITEMLLSVECKGTSQLVAPDKRTVIHWMIGLKTVCAKESGRVRETLRRMETVGGYGD